MYIITIITLLPMRYEFMNNMSTTCLSMFPMIHPIHLHPFACIIITLHLM